MHAVPSAAPSSVLASAVITSSFTLQWEEVECIHHNGDITGYLISYGVDGDSSPRQTVNALTTEQPITGLYPSTTYAIQVAAVNSAGTGVYSDQISVTTKGTTSKLNCLPCIIILQPAFVGKLITYSHFIVQ